MRAQLNLGFKDSDLRTTGVHKTYFSSTIIYIYSVINSQFLPAEVQNMILVRLKLRAYQVKNKNEPSV